MYDIGIAVYHPKYSRYLKVVNMGKPSAYPEEAITSKVASKGFSPTSPAAAAFAVGPYFGGGNSAGKLAISETVCLKYDECNQM